MTQATRAMSAAVVWRSSASTTAVVRVVSRGGSMWGYNGYGYAATAAQGAVTRLPAVTSARAVVVAVLLGASPD